MGTVTITSEKNSLAITSEGRGLAITSGKATLVVTKIDIYTDYYFLSPYFPAPFHREVE